ncbi:MAG TPA: GspH/FimT family pseudopilin [Dokdonella sp.]|nr:GspH/FimT family pseudopilin [Dokdonella sp.]HNS27641.1 GspH/FimT family pseudopilin [Steroidobacteraceae bacterium]
MKTRSTGFTLMELMIVLALAAVILAIGAPNFNEFRRNNRLTGVGNDLLGAVQTARNEAIKRQVPVAVCASANPGDDDAACSDGDYTGWIVFADPDNNCERNDADPDEDVIRVGHTVDAALTVTATGSCVSFGANGFRQTLAGIDTAGNILFCDDRGTAEQAGTGLSAARGIEVSATGRSRVTRDMVELGAAPWPACP